MKPFPYTGPTDAASVMKYVRERAEDTEREFLWPENELQALLALGAMRWAVPKEFGGDDLPALELHQRYEQLARASLALALILTQRDSAIGLIAGSETFAQREKFIRRLATHEHFTTVGIAQLTTSRQSGPPAIRAQRVERGWKINGVIPWCTGGLRAHFLVAGAATDDGRQLLYLQQQHQDGVTHDAPMRLVALRPTFTHSITLNDVIIEDRWILRGPTDKVLVQRGKSLNLGQAFLATGLCLAALDLIADHRSDLARQTEQRFTEQLDLLRTEIAALSQPNREDAAADAAPRIRGACNDLAVRITHAAVALYKGAALVEGHPAQRLAREAMFLLVWSCPGAVIDCTVDVLSRS